MLHAWEAADTVSQPTFVTSSIAESFGGVSSSLRPCQRAKPCGAHSHGPCECAPQGAAVSRPPTDERSYAKVCGMSRSRAPSRGDAGGRARLRRLARGLQDVHPALRQQRRCDPHPRPPNPHRLVSCTHRRDAHTGVLHILPVRKPRWARHVTWRLQLLSRLPL